MKNSFFVLVLCSSGLYSLESLDNAQDRGIIPEYLKCENPNEAGVAPHEVMPEDCFFEHPLDNRRTAKKRERDIVNTARYRARKKATITILSQRFLRDPDRELKELYLSAPIYAPEKDNARHLSAKAHRRMVNKHAARRSRQRQQHVIQALTARLHELHPAEQLRLRTDIEVLAQKYVTENIAEAQVISLVTNTCKNIGNR